MARRAVNGQGIRVAAGILCREGEVLLCQRGGEGRFAGKWEFPGGKLRVGESAEEALVRELAEELSIEVPPEGLHFLETLRHEYPGGPRVELHFFQVLAFTPEPAKGSFRCISWVPAARVADFDFLEADRPLVARLAAGTLLVPS